VAGIFERFTEKAIKAVMLAQNFAQKMGACEVSTPVLLTTACIFKVTLHGSKSNPGTKHTIWEAITAWPWGALRFRHSSALQTSAEYLFLGLLSEEPASKVCFFANQGIDMQAPDAW